MAKEMGVMEGAAPSINFHPFVVTADGNSIKDRVARIGGNLHKKYDPQTTSEQVGSALALFANCLEIIG